MNLSLRVSNYRSGRAARSRRHHHPSSCTILKIYKLYIILKYYNMYDRGSGRGSAVRPYGTRRTGSIMGSIVVRSHGVRPYAPNVQKAIYRPNQRSFSRSRTSEGLPRHRHIGPAGASASSAAPSRGAPSSWTAASQIRRGAQTHQPNPGGRDLGVTAQAAHENGPWRRSRGGRETVVGPK